jgi:hypothetical protein
MTATGEAEPLVEGRPELVIRDEDREAVAEAVANLLVSALRREAADAELA